MKYIYKIFTLVITFAFLTFPTNSQTALDIYDGDFKIGDINAPITIIEYSSLSCSHCANFHNNTLDKLKEEYIDTNKVRFI